MRNHKKVLTLVILVMISVILTFASTASGFTPLQQNTVQMLRSMRFALWTKDEPEPVSHGDAPRNKTAVMLSPFSTPLTPQDDTSIYFYDKDLLAYIQGKLTHIGYVIDGGRPHINQAVTVKAIYDSFMRSPGVIYFSTHSGVADDGTVNLATGERIPKESCRTDAGINRYIDQLIQREFGGQARAVRPHVVASTPNESRDCFVAITKGFFDLLKLKGADFSSSLVYIDGCDSAQSQELRAAINAKAFLGWNTIGAPQVGKIIAKNFWDCMVLKTRSDREAYDYTMNFTADDAAVKMRMQHGYKGWDVRNFKLYRRGKDTPEKWFDPVHRQILMAVRKYVCRNPQANTLSQSIQNLWDNRRKDLGTGGDDFYREAFSSGEPTDEQLTEIKGELCGYPAGIPRFTLIEKGDQP